MQKKSERTSIDQIVENMRGHQSRVHPKTFPHAQVKVRHGTKYSERLGYVREMSRLATLASDQCMLVSR